MKNAQCLQMLWDIIIEFVDIVHISSTITTSEFMFYNYKFACAVDCLIHKHSLNI